MIPTLSQFQVHPLAGLTVSALDPILRLSLDNVLADTDGLSGHEEDFVNEGTKGLNSGPDLTSCLWRAACP